MPTETRNSRKLQESCRSFLDATAELCAQHDFLRDIERDLRSISESVTHPFNVAVYGKMKRGKSSLVNALLGRTLAITDQTEATATITVISYAAPGSDLLKKFVIHWKDAPAETFALSDLKKWTGPDGQFDRIQYIQMYADDQSLQYHEIIDTPGTESTVETHQTVTENFLDPTIQIGRKADALIYVFGHNIEEADLKYLRLYQSHDSSDSFNVLGVLHRWDDTYVNNVGKGYCYEDVIKRAEAKRKELGNLVAGIVPVSAPLAIFVQGCLMRDEFIKRAITLFSGTSDQDLELLTIFDEDLEHKKLLAEMLATGMPKSSAWIVFIESARHGREGVDGVVWRLKELSGLERLEGILDRRFFSKGEVIRQCQTCRRIAATKVKFDLSVDNHLRLYENDLAAWNGLSQVSLQEKFLQEWVRAKQSAFSKDVTAIKEGVVRIDRMFINSPVGRMAEDVAVRLWIVGAGADIFSENEKNACVKFLDVCAGISDEPPDIQIIRNAIRNILGKLRTGLIPSRMRGLVNHLQMRIANFERQAAV